MIKNLGFLQLTAALAFASATVCLHAQTKTPARKTASGTTQSGPKLPANIPPAHGLLHTEYALRYIDIKVGTGAVAEPGKVYVRPLHRLAARRHQVRFVGRPRRAHQFPLGRAPRHPRLGHRF